MEITLSARGSDSYTRLEQVLVQSCMDGIASANSCDAEPCNERRFKQEEPS